MMAVDEEALKDEDEGDNGEKITECLQVTRSLSSLLLKSQKQVDGNISASQLYLSEISKFIVELQQDEKS